jgi:hypothetical protein
MFYRLSGWLFMVAVALSAGMSSTAVEKKEAGNRWAVLIGVDDYTELGKVQFAGADQRALAEQLVASGCWAT